MTGTKYIIMEKKDQKPKIILKRLKLKQPTYIWFKSIFKPNNL